MAEPTGSQGADGQGRRPVLPPPPASLTEQSEAEAKRAEKGAARERAKQERAAKAAEKKAAADQKASEDKAAAANRAAERKAAEKRAADDERDRTTSMPAVTDGPDRRPAAAAAPRRSRRAQLRLVQIDAWSVMKTAFLLSIALGIVLVVAVGIVWSVLGAAGVWDSINSIARQAVGSPDGPQFDVTDYVGTSRVLGIAMIVAVVDVILITAIATLGAFLYNLSAALLGGVEVTLAEDN